MAAILITYEIGNVSRNVSIREGPQESLANIKDIAARCKVAVSTVSRVLNNHPDVSEATRAKVLAAAAELHYVPNSSARDLAAGQANTIGVVVRGAENPFFTGIIRAIEQASSEAGYTMVLHQIKSGADEIAAAAGLAQAKRLRGIILLGGRYDYTRKDLSAITVPIVCCTFTNHFGDLDRSAFSSVSINDKGEAYRATKELIDRGHKKIAVVLDSVNDRSISERRYKGFCEAMADAGLTVDEDLVVETVDFSMGSAYERTRELLERRRDFTAMFVIADSMAIAAMKAISDAGLSVPQDISIIAIDGLEMSLYTVPTLTTLVQPQATLGSEAVRILVDVLDKGAACAHVRLETTLRPGGTVGQAHLGTMHHEDADQKEE